MPGYVDLATLATPVAGGSAPAGWGLQTRDNFERIVRPPRFKVSRTVAQSIATGVTTAVVWNAATFDAGYTGGTGHYNATATVTIRDTGMWVIGYTVRMEAAAAGVRLFYIQVNGATNYAVSEQPAAGNAWLVGYSGGDVVQLTAGDTLVLNTFHTAGVAVNVGTTQPLTMWGRWLGPSS